MLEVLAFAAAGVDVLLAFVIAWGLDQEANSGQRWKSPFVVAFLLAPAATVYAVSRTVDAGAGPWLAVTAIAPLAMLVLLIVDRDALWGNFPPSAAGRALQRVAAVAVFALPGLLAWAAA